MTEIQVDVGIDLERLRKILIKMLDLIHRKKYKPEEVYLACHLLLADIEHDFKITLTEDTKAFIKCWREQEL